MIDRVRTAVIAACALAFSLGGVTSASAANADTSFLGNTLALFSGVDVTEGSWFVYGGGLYALHGLDKSGPAVKAVIGGGEFNYISPFNPNGGLTTQGIQGDNFTFDVLGGYRVYVGKFLVGAYAGLNYWDIDHESILSGGNPPTPPGAKAFGDEYGLKVEGEVTYVGPTAVFLDLRGSYSTAFDTYWAQGRFGHDIGVFTIGPEAAINGNEDYDQLRIGGFIMFNFWDSVYLTISGGYADTSGIGEDGAYGTAGLVATF